MVNVNSKQTTFISFESKTRAKSAYIRELTMENDDDARKSLLPGNRRSQADTSTRTYYDMQQPSSTTKILQLAFIVIVIFMVVLSLIFSIYRSAVLSNGIYILLGLGLVGFLAVEVIMILFIRNGDLAVEKTWFLYAAGGCIVIECIFTNILLFR